jgi:two-component system, response regulator RegA
LFQEIQALPPTVNLRSKLGCASVSSVRQLGVCREKEQDMPLRSECQPSAIAAESRGPVEAESRSLLLVDDDRLLVARLRRGLEANDYEVEVVETVAAALLAIATRTPDCAIVEARLPDGSGLDVVEALVRARPDARALVLTGYGNIASAVSAIKRGATDYLAKPAGIEDIHAALNGHTDSRPPVASRPMSADRVRWEHIQRIYETCDRNVSETARRLGMHRRTLQRILAKRAPR